MRIVNAGYLNYFSCSVLCYLAYVTFNEFSDYIFNNYYMYNILYKIYIYTACVVN